MLQNLSTVELGFGQDAPADGEAVLPVAHVEGRDGGVVGHLRSRRTL